MITQEMADFPKISKLIKEQLNHENCCVWTYAEGFTCRWIKFKPYSEKVQRILLTIDGIEQREQEPDVLILKGVASRDIADRIIEILKEQTKIEFFGD